MRSPLLVALAALAAAAALAVPALSASTPPQLTSVDVGSLRTSSTGLKLSVAGTIDCSAGSHFHLWLWIYESDRGALAHGLVPKSSTRRLSKKAERARTRAETCTGSAKAWSLHLPSEGKHPAPFAREAAQVCTVATVSHSRRYVMQSTCSDKPVN